MSDECAGRTVIVTGAGGGLGRSYALALGAAGASVVVNDIVADAAATTAAAIEAAGGRAVADTGDITDHASAGEIFRKTLDTFGDVHAIVNNAGICRDRMFASMTEDDWDAVVEVHLKGHFCLSNHAAKYWRGKAKAGDPVDGRIVNTSSGAGLLGSMGQSNYAAAKGGILSLTLVQAAELGRYGVTANALAPQARTGMTEQVFADMMRPPEDGGFDAFSPDNVAPLVVWLASPRSAEVSGCCFEMHGGRLSIAEGWRHGTELDHGGRWAVADLDDAVRRLLALRQAPEPVYGASA
ncbi:MAG: SDR family oxidoreductase [Pseudomonadota bacterium]